MNRNLADQLALLPDHLSRHLLVSLTALALGVSVSLPLALAVARRPRARAVVLAVTGVVQTIPALALLALMVPLLGAFGFWPAVAALALYSMLPVVRNTVTGIAGIDADLIEAARALGMTPRQRLLRVELPLAAPVIVAGFRTATVWVIGMATLSTPVGQTSLGNFIFSGLQTRNWTAVLVGCGAAAVLALVLDLWTGAIEAAVRARRGRRAALLLGGLALLLLGGLAPLAAADGSRQPVRIGAKTFTEQYVLAELLAQVLQDAGFAVAKIESLGSTIAFDALVEGDLDVYVDYSGTLWANVLRRDDVLPAAALLAELRRVLPERLGVHVVGALGFENTYALALRRDRAEALDVRTIADLVPHAPALSLGSDYEFLARPEWRRLRAVHPLRFGATRTFDSSFLYAAVRDGEVDVITAFSSDGRIAAFDLVTLADEQHAFPPYDAVLLVSAAAARRSGLVAALEPLLGTIDVERMRHANGLVDLAGRDVAEAARALR